MKALKLKLEDSRNHHVLREEKKTDIVQKAQDALDALRCKQKILEEKVILFEKTKMDMKISFVKSAELKRSQTELEKFRRDIEESQKHLTEMESLVYEERKSQSEQPIFEVNGQVSQLLTKVREKIKKEVHFKHKKEIKQIMCDQRAAMEAVVDAVRMEERLLLRQKR